MIATLFSQAFQSDVKNLIKKVDKAPSYAEWTEDDKETIVKHLQAVQDYIEKCHIKSWRQMKRTSSIKNPKKNEDK